MTLTTEEQLYHFVDDLEKTMSFVFELDGEFDDILMCGMGGSAISSDIVMDLCFERSKVPLKVVKYPMIPKWVGKRTLVICSTYSGNTQEIISAYEQALSVGSTVVVITAGGRIKDLADRDGVPLIMMPSGMHPRHSIGFMIGYTLAVVRAGGGPDISGDILSCIDSLREYRDSVNVKGTGKAWKMAEGLQSRVPIMLSDMALRSVAFRWKTQINENAKYVAFTNQAQEFNRCALDAWNSDRYSNGCLLVLSGSDTDIFNSIVEKMEGYGCSYHLERFDGKSIVENLFRAVILGDYISMYMAEIRGIDSGVVPPISRLKELLKERL